jgi:hypothetical protein
VLVGAGDEGLPPLERNAAFPCADLDLAVADHTSDAIGIIFNRDWGNECGFASLMVRLKEIRF